jgi:hypothetical protein
VVLTVEHSAVATEAAGAFADGFRLLSLPLSAPRSEGRRQPRKGQAKELLTLLLPLSRDS